jgi:hypothetical protein
MAEINQRTRLVVVLKKEHFSSRMSLPPSAFSLSRFGLLKEVSFSVGTGVVDYWPKQNTSKTPQKHKSKRLQS